MSSVDETMEERIEDVEDANAASAESEAAPGESDPTAS
jgi:hypothetical protein